MFILEHLLKEEDFTVHCPEITSGYPVEFIFHASYIYKLKPWIDRLLHFIITSLELLDKGACPVYLIGFIDESTFIRDCLKRDITEISFILAPKSRETIAQGAIYAPEIEFE